MLTGLCLCLPQENSSEVDKHNISHIHYKEKKRGYPKIAAKFPEFSYVVIQFYNPMTLPSKP